MDKQDQRKTKATGHENHGVHLCHKCGWPFPNPHPSPKHRRAHKRICGTIEGYKLVKTDDDTSHVHLSNDEHHSDEDRRKTPSPRGLESSDSREPGGGVGERLISGDEVFADAVAEFSDGGWNSGAEENLRENLEPVTAKDESAHISNDDGFGGSAVATENQLRKNSRDPETPLTTSFFAKVPDCRTEEPGVQFLDNKPGLPSAIYPNKDEGPIDGLHEGVSVDAGNGVTESAFSLQVDACDNFDRNIPSKEAPIRIFEETSKLNVNDVASSDTEGARDFVPKEENSAEGLLEMHQSAHSLDVELLQHTIISANNSQVDFGLHTSQEGEGKDDNACEISVSDDISNTTILFDDSEDPKGVKLQISSILQSHETIRNDEDDLKDVTSVERFIVLQSESSSMASEFPLGESYVADEDATEQNDSYKLMVIEELRKQQIVEPLVEGKTNVDQNSDDNGASLVDLGPDMNGQTDSFSNEQDSDDFCKFLEVNSPDCPVSTSNIVPADVSVCSVDNDKHTIGDDRQNGGVTEESDLAGRISTLQSDSKEPLLQKLPVNIVNGEDNSNHKKLETKSLDTVEFQFREFSMESEGNRHETCQTAGLIYNDDTHHVEEIKTNGVHIDGSDKLDADTEKHDDETKTATLQPSGSVSQSQEKPLISNADGYGLGVCEAGEIENINRSEDQSLAGYLGKNTLPFESACGNGTGDVSVKKSQSILCKQSLTLQILLCTFFFSVTSYCATATLDRASMPKFAFSWLNDKETFKAGEIATIKIKVLENGDKIDRDVFDPTINVNGKVGNSSYISTLMLNIQGDTNDWTICFTPIKVGVFNVMINETYYHVFDSSMHFRVEPGTLYPSACVAAWTGLRNEFDAGSKAAVMITPRDAFGNNMTANSEVPDSNPFALNVFHENGSFASIPNITYMGWDEFGYITIEFIAMKAGNLSLSIDGGNQTLNGSPLPFKVNPGMVDISKCVAKWNYEPNAWQLFSKMEIFIHQLDEYGNLVPGLYTFDAEVIERETKLSIPVADLHFEEVNTGIQLFSFSNLEPGNFLLTIYDIKHNKTISNMPYAYTVFVGYCDGMNSVVNGSGLNDSTAGEIAEFYVYLKDKYQYPSQVEIERLQVHITRENDSYRIWAAIHPAENLTESKIAADLVNGDTSHAQIAPAPSLEMGNSSNSSAESAFNVIYTPDKIGIYNIHVFCGNVLLNGGHAFTKQVKAGTVNVSVSGVVKFSPKVAKKAKNEVVVRLMDSYLNPVLFQQSKLKLEIASVNSSGFSTWPFADNKDGTYSGYYLAEEVGTYEMCVSFDGRRFSPCPFGANIYGSEYFPKACDDTISVWEEESISFDALENDYFAGHNASIVEFSKTGSGSLLYNGKIFRYTPYRNYYGNDSFWYTISDINGNHATAYVHISVLRIPPQFISFSSELHATEDVISPRFGGFSGFEIKYSELMEKISVNLSAQSGTILMSPMLMQFRKPTESSVAINTGNESSKSLLLEGPVKTINSALQSIQYLGNENFSGVDYIRVSTKNKNGINVMDVPVYVDPINDPPFIQVPRFIILNADGKKSLIFDAKKDKFDFVIGDPDLPNFPGKRNEFLLTFSVEVNNGFLATSLPAHLISTTELKLRRTYQWQPLQTYVSISKHVTIKANGIRFRGTVDDCNSAMQQLFFEGGEQGAILTVALNDMGNYGCYPDCAENTSTPLYTEEVVNLIRRRPMSSLVAHALGLTIIVEFVAISTLGVLLVFFTCKCAILLVHDKVKFNKGSSNPASTKTTEAQPSCIKRPESPPCFTGCYPTTLSLSNKSSMFRQRSKRMRFHSGESITASSDHSSPSTKDMQPASFPRLLPTYN